MKNLKGNLLLTLTAFIWGTAFVAQSTGLKHIAPFTFNAIRMMLGTLVLLPVIYFMSRKKKDTGKKTDLILGGLLCGTALFIASSFQQFGLLETDPGKAGFITSLYIVIVPLIEALGGKKLNKTTIIAVAVAIVGMYLLCMSSSMSVTAGDLLIFACSVFFSFHILIIDRFSDKTDGVKLSCLQFFVVSILSGICALIFEIHTPQKIMSAAFPLIYTGVFSSGVAYTLQIIGQKYTSPVLATIIMSLESVFAGLAGWAILKDTMSPRELAGAALIFAAIIFAQLPRDFFKNLFAKKKQG